MGCLGREAGLIVKDRNPAAHGPQRRSDQVRVVLPGHMIRSHDEPAEVLVNVAGVTCTPRGAAVYRDGDVHSSAGVSLLF